MRVMMLRVAFSVALVAILATTAAATSAKQVPEGPQLVVANPTAGDMVTPGALIMQGVAFDTTATTGVGVDRVSVFLGDRDAGGMFLGDAKLGAPSIVPTPSDQFGMAGWTLLTPAFKGVGETKELRVYARSAVTGAETMVEIPITIGEKVVGTGGAGTSGGYTDQGPAGDNFDYTPVLPGSPY